MSDYARTRHIPGSGDGSEERFLRGLSSYSKTFVCALSICYVGPDVGLIPGYWEEDAALRLFKMLPKLDYVLPLMSER